MPKVHRVENMYGEGRGGWMFHCPACNCSHGPADTWTFNGNVEKPTFRPSILVKWFKYDDLDKIIGPDGKIIVGENGKVAGKDMICHSFVTDGKIEYLNDSTHALAGQTIDLPEWD